MKALNLPVIMLPGVKHLPSVPEWRKYNKIDLGTADKVCSATFALAYLSEIKGKGFGDINFILAELGSNFNAFLAVKEGKIVDGIGGTLASSGFHCLGKIDGEIAAWMGEIKKETVYEGGVVSLGCSTLSSMLKSEILTSYFIEGIIKDVASLSTLWDDSFFPMLVFTGNLSKDRKLQKKLSNNTYLKNFEIYFLEDNRKVSTAAEGAAMIADGIVGGKFKLVVEHMEIKNAKGSVFDHLYLPKFRI